MAVRAPLGATAIWFGGQDDIALLKRWYSCESKASTPIKSCSRGLLDGCK